MNIKTVLFDFDGTLIDTNELIYQSFLHTLSAFGYNLSKEEIQTFNGPPLRDTFQRIDPENAEEMLNVYRKHNFENHEKYVSLFPNVKETLEKLKENNIQIGIVTAKMRPSVEHGMKITNISNYMDTVVTIDDVVHPKPHPESVWRAMESLNASAESSIMVGDNYHDIEAGNRAGISTAGVTWSVKGEAYLRQYNPTYMLDNMLDLLPIVGV